ncbi:Uncharacterised protein [Mycobacterium tuberculosis]|nr:Uncharacterised protein [Mycobacterium tuberculosis]
MCTVAGSISPGSTKCSTSAIVILPADAHSGLKLAAAWRYIRLPCRSPCQACTSAKSVRIPRSRT